MKKIEKQQIERIVRKNFQSVNNDGLGFLETNINKCVNELYELLTK